MRAWIDRTNDGLSGMPAEGVTGTNPRTTIPLIFRRTFEMASGSEIFWTALSEGPVRLKLRGVVNALSFSCSEAHPERPEEEMGEGLPRRD